MGYTPEEHHHQHTGESGMNVADMFALMQSNKGMDLPGILALARENGGTNQDWWWIILLFLFIGNNGGGLFGANRGAAEAALGGAENLQIVTSLYDRIASAQSTTEQGFSNLSTQLCESIAAVTASVRNQGDRTYDATMSVGNAVRDCCCKLEASLATLGCKIDSVSRDISAMGTRLSGDISLAYERVLNSLQGMEGRLSLQAERNQNVTNDKFCQLDNKINMNRLEDENARLREIVQGCRTNEAANTAVDRMERFLIAHYTPSTTASASK